MLYQVNNPENTSPFAWCRVPHPSRFCLTAWWTRLRSRQHRLYLLRQPLDHHFHTAGSPAFGRESLARGAPSATRWGTCSRRGGGYSIRYFLGFARLTVKISTPAFLAAFSSLASKVVSNAPLRIATSR